MSSSPMRSTGSFTDKELDVAEILLDLPRLVIVHRWQSKKKRSIRRVQPRLLLPATHSLYKGITPPANPDIHYGCIAEETAAAEDQPPAAKRIKMKFPNPNPNPNKEEEKEQTLLPEKEKDKDKEALPKVEEQPAPVIRRLKLTMRDELGRLQVFQVATGASSSVTGTEKKKKKKKKQNGEGEGGGPIKGGGAAGPGYKEDEADRERSAWEVASFPTGMVGAVEVVQGRRGGGGRPSRLRLTPAWMEDFESVPDA